MPNDAKTYSAQLMTLLAEYPLWAGERAVQDRVQTKKWLPTVSQLRKALEEQVRVIRDADARDETRRVANAARLAGPVPEPRPTYEELKAKYGPNWGIRDRDGRTKREPTKTEAFAELVARVGQAAVDAIPDAPPRERSLGDVASE